MTTEPNSRAATNALLAGLRQGGWRPRAWTRFLRDATRRSVHQARSRPRALAEITVLHIVFAAASRRKYPVWTVVSWVLATTHLGMLEHRRSLGIADVVTLTRANLPALTDSRAVPVVALTSDLADGHLARKLGTTSPFGAAADSLADAAFWAWFALRHEPSRRVRAAAGGLGGPGHHGHHSQLPARANGGRATPGRRPPGRGDAGRAHRPRPSPLGTRLPRRKSVRPMTLPHGRQPPER